MVAGKLNFRPRGGKWRRRFGVRVRVAAGWRFGACVRCEGRGVRDEGGEGAMGNLECRILSDEGDLR